MRKIQSKGCKSLSFTIKYKKNHTTKSMSECSRFASLLFFKILYASNITSQSEAWLLIEIHRFYHRRYFVFPFCFFQMQTNICLIVVGNTRATNYQFILHTHTRKKPRTHRRKIEFKIYFEIICYLIVTIVNFSCTH